MSSVEARKKKTKVLFTIICIVTSKQQKQNQKLKLEMQLEFLNIVETRYYDTSYNDNSLLTTHFCCSRQNDSRQNDI